MHTTEIQQRYRPASQAPSQKGLWLAVFIASGLLYALTAQRGYSWEDAGIFQYRASQQQPDLVGGLGLALAHPLYITLGWLLKFIPGLTLAWKLNIFSSLAMAAALASFAAVANLLTGRLAVAVACTAMFAVAHTSWWLGTIADVMPVQLAVFMAEIWILVLLLRQPTWRRLVALALASGIDLSFHNLALLPLPVYFALAIWLIAKRQLPPWSLPAAAGAWIVGASPYLVIIYQQIQAGLPVAQAMRSALVGDSYGPAVASTSFHLSNIRKANYAFMFLSIAGTPLVLAVIGSAVLRRKVGTPLAVAMAAITLIELAFVLRYDVPDQFTFFLPSLAMIELVAAVGLGWLMDRGKVGGRVGLALAGLFVVAMPIFYWQAPELVRRYHGGYSRARTLPFRDELRYWLTPWKQNENSAMRFASAAVDQLEATGHEARIIADDTPMYPLLMEISARKDENIRVVWSASPILHERLKDPTALLCQLRGLDLYTVSNAPGYAPPELLGLIDPQPTGMLYRVRLPDAAACSKPATRAVRADPKEAKQDYFQAHLGQKVTLVGQAQAWKVGPLLVTEHGGVYIGSFHFDHPARGGVGPNDTAGTEDRSEWPDDVRDKRIRVSGVLAERYDLPVLPKEESKSGELQGIPTSFPAGSKELQKAGHRYVIEDARYEIVR